MRTFRIIFSFVLISFFAGCSKKNVRVQNKHLASQDAYSLIKEEKASDLGNSLWVDDSQDYAAHARIKQQEAQLVDISIPLHAQSLGFHEASITSSSDSLMLAYRIDWQYENICSFFTVEMERLGWELMANLKDVESLLVFAKPTKICTVSLRQCVDSDNQADSFLMVLNYGNNKAGYSHE